MVAALAVWGWPQYVMIFLYALALLVGTLQHGKVRTETTDRNNHLFAVLLSIWVLGAGGFFS